MKQDNRDGCIGGNIQTNSMLALKAKIAERKALKRRTIEKLQAMSLDFERLRKTTLSVSARRSEAQIARRSQLEREIGLVRREILKEELACWRDVAQLESELREVQIGIELSVDDES